MRRKRGSTDASVIGFDSETLKGPPITLQFYSEDVANITAILWVDTANVTEKFLSHMRKLKPGLYRMYGHHLPFDLVSAFWPHRRILVGLDIATNLHGWTVAGRYGHPSFVVLSRGKVRVEIIDAMLWFSTSLERAAEIVCPDLPKLARPLGLGEKMFKRSDTHFVEYAMRDAEVSYHEGKAIELFHSDQNIKPSYSLAGMAATIFQQRFQKQNIMQPPKREWMAGALASYHGGVNRVRKGAYPAWHRDVVGWDFSSAYPRAMRDFPSFCDANAYKSYDGKFRPSEETRLGVYCVSGTAKPCDWPVIFDHNFKPIQGRFKDIWVHGNELVEGLRANELTISSCKGFLYDQSEDLDASPFREFVETFYKLKSEAKDPVLRHMYKIVLNALTGKFIQTSPDYIDVGGSIVVAQKAGGLYHPFIASSITSHTRAGIHSLEHEVKAIHTATDGVFAPRGKTPKNRGSGLGSIQLESQGDLVLLRNKLYILYGKAPAKGSWPSLVFPGKHVLKAARHGFQGTIRDLEEMVAHGHRTYKTNKPNQLKQALQRGLVANEFVESQRRLNIGPITKVYGEKEKTIRRTRGK